MDTDHFDITALTPGDVRPGQEEQMAMVRQLLADRFHLTFHRQPKEMPVYTVTIAKGGLKLKLGTPYPDDEAPPPLVFVLAPTIVRVPARNTTVRELTYILQRTAFDRPVLDKTGLTDRYDFELEFAPDESLFIGVFRSKEGDPTKPGIFAAMQEQLGLKLEATRDLVDTLVIDNVDHPSEN